MVHARSPDPPHRGQRRRTTPKSPLKKSNSAYVRPLRPMAALRSLAESRGFTSIASLALGRNSSASAAKRLCQRTPIAILAG